MRLAIILPVLNEQANIVAALARLASLRERGTQVIVVDGGSTDATVLRAQGLADQVLVGPGGRGNQMNHGAAAALANPHTDTLLFLHADTSLPPDADRVLATACRPGEPAWGRFDVRIAGRSPMLPMVAMLMNLRSRLTGICTGDQCLFVTRPLFRALNGYAAIPLMEDIEFSRRARRIARPIALPGPAVTSGRRWEQAGVFRTIALMWRLRAAYFFGADPQKLSTAYRDAR